MTKHIADQILKAFHVGALTPAHKILIVLILLLMAASSALAGFCSQCGGQVNAGAAFCSGCGARLNSGQQQQNVSAPQEGKVWIADLGSGATMEFVPIATGSFMMGSDVDSDEKPAHRVTLTQPYWMVKTEVTQAQYERVMGVNPSNFKGAQNPVDTVSWNNAVEFCRKLTAQERQAGRLPEGYEYTLPTEAQWEYACRAGTTGDYAGDRDSMGWYDDNSEKTTHLVGQKQPNAWGLYDMHGNVYEWCSDWYGDYPSGSVTDPRGATSGSYRVLRSGSWFFFDSACRSANRNCTTPEYADKGQFGFRPIVQQK
jgi:formylglycine-generating enzyme required for sulfatase activity